MNAADWGGLVGIFFGGALPWLEAVVVIPGGIIAGLPLVPVVVSAVVGNLLTVALAAWFGERIQAWFSTRRSRREARRHDEETLARKEAKRARGQQRVERVMNRGGMPALGLLGPLIGTQFIAVAVIAMGVSARRSFLWVGAGTVAWSVLVAALTAGGYEVLGVG